MDHPGFHGRRWVAPDRLAINWLGGSPVKHVNGARVWLATDEGLAGTGTLTGVKLTPSRRSMASATVRLKQTPDGGSRPGARRVYGGFDFGTPVRRSGCRLYARAADDLVGVYAILQTAVQLARRGSLATSPFLGLLTRAEEVGFIGAIGHLELGWLTRAERSVMCVSLEASRTLPGAVIGKGPVVRLGDRRTVFHADGLKTLRDLARRRLRGRHQSRIMDGGACEASVTTAYGLPTIGISVPLGNYHNQGFEGGLGCRAPEGPAPEFVHLEDVNGLLRLCTSLVSEKLDWTHPWEDVRAKMNKDLRRYQHLLR